MTKRKIIERLRDDLAALHAVGAIRKVVMRKFDAVVPPAVRQFIPKSTKRLVKPIKFSCPVFAHHRCATSDCGIAMASAWSLSALSE